jgi:Protein of unknown function (DUF2568)
MKALNLALAFLLELALLGVLGFWGFHLGHMNTVHWLAGLGVPLVTAVIWGKVAAPKAKKRLPRVPLLVFKVMIFTLGAAALYTAGKHTLALGFEAVSLLSLALAFIWEQ